MSGGKVSFIDSKGYPVIFMILITMLFIGILATFYHATIDRISIYQEISYRKALLDLFGLPQDNIEADYSNYIRKIVKDNIQYYEASRDSNLIGYAFEIKGNGLWGTITALIAVNQDITRLLKIEILSQNETPGLGGRITEKWFKNQFSNKLIWEDGALIQFNLVPENEEISDSQIRQITGATSSSKAVVDMIFRNLQKINEKMDLTND
ncbi:MAG: FMN-binding protein [Candidatus Cloacimonetes bacterium]|nr:FMN-binding protein [Candidatus Cloacimonadota bacterium]